MKTFKVLIGAIWLLVVGGNIVDVLTISPHVFMDVPPLPWPIALMPAIVVVGAYLRRTIGGGGGYSFLVSAADQRFGKGAAEAFVEALKPRLMLSAMCLGIVLAALARATLFGVTVMPPVILGFFASGGVAFFIAHLIRRRPRGR